MVELLCSDELLGVSSGTRPAAPGESYSDVIMRLAKG
jgi:hypothetical protein